MSKETFAARLARLRVARGLSQNQLAKLAGLTASAVSNLEAGKREPLLRTALVLAVALNVPVGEMVGMEGEKQ